MARNAPDTQPKEAAVLTKAFLNAASRLGLDQQSMARVLGVSPASMSRTAAGDRLLEPRTNEGEKALYFLRIYRSLDSVLGGESDKARAWFTAYNQHLGAVPADMVVTFQGLNHVAEYLDAMRGVL